MVVLLGSQPLLWGPQLLLVEGRDSVLSSCFWIRSTRVGECLRRQLHSCSRGALVTPVKAACGDVLALASCCPKVRHGRLCRAVCQIQLSMVIAVGLAARGDDAEGEGGRKSSL